MKIKFWKNRTEIMALCVFLGISVIFMVIGAISFSNLFPLFICGAISGLFCILILFLYKAPLTKIIISEKGIECKWLKHTTILIDWNEITDIKEKVRSFALSYLSLITEHKQIDIDLSKKMYETIMVLCPYEHVKSKINDIQYFKYLHD